MYRASSALVLYGRSERYRGSIDSKDVGSHSSCSLVSAIRWDPPARTATSDHDRAVKDRNASSDLEQHNKTVKDRKAVGRRVILLVVILCRSPARTAADDDDGPVKDRNASSDLEKQTRTVKDQKAVRSWVVFLVGHSQKIPSSKTTFEASDAVNPTPPRAELRKRNYSIECRNFIGDPTIRRTSAVIHDAYLSRYSSATVLRIAPSDDDRPGEDKSAGLDLVQQNRTVGDQNAVNIQIVLQVDDSQRIISSRATLMLDEASDPIPQ
ncbi:hypothetical protein QAD02_002249 [Eretmocerus hayati]|uniref:Uncharacterized protein n=1 Tax=Eretmocerus hayati TaxID=131215 RepID=A0ACC2NID4_9HYME|nr:hypothetical protein QAD02_002249 [Eretmocerus hayati]